MSDGQTSEIGAALANYQRRTLSGKIKIKSCEQRHQQGRRTGSRAVPQRQAHPVYGGRMAVKWLEA